MDIFKKTRAAAGYAPAQKMRPCAGGPALPRRILWIVSILLASWFSAEAATADFAPVAKIFSEHCFDCHGVQDPEGKLVLETYDLAMRGGESGPAIVPGKSSESLLVRMIEGKFEKDGKARFMPPGKRDKLSEEQVALVKAWIDAGAKPPEEPMIAKAIVAPAITPKVPPRRAIHSIAHDGKSKLLALGRMGEVELHSSEEQSMMRAFAGPAGNVNAVVFSADGKTLYAGGGDSGIRGEIRQWNVVDWTLERSIAAHNDSIFGLAISPDGKILATGSYDQKIKLWNTETGAEIRTLSGHNGCVYALAFRADGKILASASGDRTVKLWDVASGDRRDTLSQPLKEQYTVAFSPDGRRLAAAGVDRRIRVWEISDEARETTNPMLHSKFAHEGSILKLAYSADGKSIISSAEDKTVKLWGAEQLQEHRALETQPDWAPALAFILEDKGVVVGRLDGSLGYYDAKSGGTLPLPRPELARLEPGGVQRGVTSRLKLTGKALQTASAIKFSDSRLSGTLMKEDKELWVEVSSEPAMPRGVHTFTVTAQGGESGSLKLYVDDLAQFVEQENDATQVLSTLPLTIWGTHRESGEKDVYEFEANEGEVIVFDGAAKTVGSKADLVLSLLDAGGKVLASNNGFDKSSEPLIAHRFSATGRYRLLVQELVPGGSADHFYRVSIGAFPFVTATYPPVAQKEAAGRIKLIGFNLRDDEEVELPLKLDPEKFRWRGEIKVSPTDLPLQLESGTNSLPIPGIVAGRLAAGDEADWFRFEARAGQALVVETRAESFGSPVDTKIEIRDEKSEPVVRALLQAVRDSAVTFRGIDSVTVDCRVENWEEMELNQFLYLQGEVVRLFRAPQGPDSGFNFYGLSGRRRTYFDTTASAHANAEPCYIVQPHPPGAKLAANGLPIFPVYFENDDDGERKLGSDSRVYFTAPKDGTYLVRVSDSRGFSGERFTYTLTVRESRPDFKISIDGANPTVAKGSGQRFAVNAERFDGFDGEIKVEVAGLPPGFAISNPIIIQAGHSTAFGTLHAADHAEKPATETIKLLASAEINGQTVQHDGPSLGKITLTETAPLYVTLESATPEITIVPGGGTVPAHLKIRRNGHAELVTFQVENLPHGVIVDNIGLNGVLIPKDQNEREIFLTAARWVPETDRLCYAVSNEGGRQTSLPVLIKVRKTSRQVAKN